MLRGGALQGGFYEALTERLCDAATVGAGRNLPGAAQHVWRWFIELDAARQGSMGAEPIDFRQIEAWASLRKIALDDWEVSALRRMDVARRKALADPPKITPGGFKALFGRR